MDLSWLKAIAPTIATALGGPLGGLAVSIIGEAFGWDESTKEKVDEVLKSGSMSGEQIAALKIAEVNLVAKLKELDIDLEKLHAGDRNSARQMQQVTRSLVPGFLAFLVTAGFFGILVGMMAGGLKVADNQALLILLGALATSWGAIVQFYFGSSKGSEDKNLLALQNPRK